MHVVFLVEKPVEKLDMVVVIDGGTAIPPSSI